MNTECDRIAYALTSAINGEAWYGDPLRKILEGVTAKQAQTHPIANAHSIWELVLHLEAWVKLAHGAMGGQPIPSWPGMPKELDWPPVGGTDDQSWARAVSSLIASHLNMAEEIKKFGDPRLKETVPGRTYDFFHLFHSEIQHAVYHAGQIALLKKIA